jgi:hypothetical protein
VAEDGAAGGVGKCDLDRLVCLLVQGRMNFIAVRQFDSKTLKTLGELRRLEAWGKAGGQTVWFQRH